MAVPFFRRFFPNSVSKAGMPIRKGCSPLHSGDVTRYQAEGNMLEQGFSQKYRGLGVVNTAKLSGNSSFSPSLITIQGLSSSFTAFSVSSILQKKVWKDL